MVVLILCLSDGLRRGEWAASRGAGNGERLRRRVDDRQGMFEIEIADVRFGGGEAGPKGAAQQHRLLLQEIHGAGIVGTQQRAQLGERRLLRGLRTALGRIGRSRRAGHRGSRL
ncbi:hypothetical protein, partial [Paracidovorax cattleyae]|uniref:hypothetical protein n=1 Tax=Paracidovorax cattleyae TaxID=80868 RepID=UPI0018AFD551